MIFSNYDKGAACDLKAGTSPILTIDEILKYNEEDLQATWAVFRRLKNVAGVIKARRTSSNKRFRECFIT